jgi:1-deoxy-D-xylulose-5-phosphate synthase
MEIAGLLERNGISCKVVNARFLKPLDKDALLRDARNMPLVTLENTLSGTGLDMLADRLLITEKHCGILHFAWTADTPIPHGSNADLREKFGLTAAAAAETIRNRFFAQPKEQEPV